MGVAYSSQHVAQVLATIDGLIPIEGNFLFVFSTSKSRLNEAIHFPAAAMALLSNSEWSFCIHESSAIFGKSPWVSFQVKASREQESRALTFIHLCAKHSL